ncbi:MAG: hypothetical protein QM785_00485 [Pyrinomonadaceae bacterium]
MTSLLYVGPPGIRIFRAKGSSQKGTAIFVTSGGLGPLRGYGGVLMKPTEY